MRAFLTYLTALLLLLALLAPAEAIWGKKKPAKKEQPSGKDSAELGLEAFQELFSDPKALEEIMAMQRDPELMAEVEALMDDPEFQKYMEEYMASPEVQQSLKMAEKIANDPAALGKFQEQLAAALGGGNEYSGKDSAQLGLDTLAQTVRDPTVMQEAMKMLSDPSIAAEVQQMMNDPAFQAEMKRITNSPLFKEAMAQAQEITKEIQNDPAKMQAFMEDLQKQMGDLAGAGRQKVGAGGRRVEL